MRHIACLSLFVLASSALACSSSSSSAVSSDASAADSPQPQADSSSPTSDAASASDSSAVPDSSGSTDSGGSDSAAPLSFATDIYGPIIHDHCIFCHGPTADGGAGSGIAFGKLDMSSVDAGYSNLVNVAAKGGDCADVDGSTLVRVVPGDAGASLLYLKVNGFTTKPPCGSPMPKSGEIPDGGQAEVVAQIQEWINQGAQP
jgi:hypothetical protein